MRTVQLLKNYYQILGIDRSADINQIQKAFRAKVKQVHPDVVEDKEQAKNDFIIIREAFDVLKDRGARAEYDERWDQQYGEKQDLAVMDDFVEDDEGFLNTPSKKSEDLYKREWEFFVKKPEEYMGMFFSVKKTISSSMISILSLSLSLVFSTIVAFISATLLAFFIIAVISVLAAVSISTLLGIIAVIFFAAMVYEWVEDMYEKLVNGFSRILSRQLIRVPRETGKSFLIFIYSLFIIMGIIGGYHLNDAVYTALGYKKLLAIIFYNAIHPFPILDLVAGALGAVIDAAFFILLNASLAGALFINGAITLKTLRIIGKTEYAKVKIVKQTGIEYQKTLLIE